MFRTFLQGPLFRIAGIVVLGIMALGLWSQPCRAHPHVFIQTELEVELGERGILGIWHHWTFDEFFSAWIVDEFDTDRDGIFSPEETRILYEEAFKNLKNYGFWTRVLNGDREISIDGLKHFSVKVRDNMATYSFFLFLDLAIPSESEIFIAVFDGDFYCQIFFPPETIKFKGETSHWNIDYTNQKMPELTYYFGFITPVAVKISIAPS